MSDTIFTKIIRREIPADIVFEDDRALAFRDINPQAPTHILVIPKKEIESLDTLSAEDGPLVAHLFTVAAQVAKEQGLTKGWRAVVNVGKNAGQTVAHLHVHVLGGRQFSWPPG